MLEEKSTDSSALMQIVEKIAITPDDARAIVVRYVAQYQNVDDENTEKELTDLVVKKIIARYSKMAATTGAATSLAGVVPGIGTAVAMVGGGLADIAACMKIQIDMTMCLCIAINDEITNEDAKHMSYVIALAGSLEQVATTVGAEAASKAAVKVVENTLKGATLHTIKVLFKQIGITFTKKAFQKAIPFGIGTAISAGANYYLTKFVGGVARDVLWAEGSPKKSPA